MDVVGIDLKGVCKTYSARGEDVQAVDGVSFRVLARGFTAVVGPSGCGKSTLLKLIGGLEEPTTGVVRVDDMSPDQARRRRHFSYGFQNPVLLPWLTVIKNVRLLPHMARQSERSPAADLLKVVGLGGFEGRYPSELSGGMRQRVSLARALTLAPQYLLLDEPFGALDDFTREALDDVLAATWASGGFGCLLVTHNLSEAVYLADEVLVMSPRPGSIRGAISVGFPRPRTPDLRLSVAFLEKVCEVRELLA